ncbi:hypothetical protein ACO0RG_001350 [Hanseniaspora osmophila]|uniref:DNA-directed RNA polymerase II subunit RPB4 n=1 Tax=Hanseniaspora osmophila TaxID=56408 RepID=A0A1E5RNA2_9ASCO|nr:DNA-directed RNA polymerase II subunit RPB4 [Hanseniaspora osmophila]
MNVSTSTFLTKRRTLRRDNDVEEENAALLQLGDEFQLKQVNHQGEEEELMALNLSEARLVIREALQERREFFKLNTATNKINNTSSTSITTTDKHEENEIFGNQQSVEQELQNVDKVLEYSSIKDTGGPGTSAATSSGAVIGPVNNQALKQTLIYLANFSRFRDPETVTAVAQLLRSASTNNTNTNNSSFSVPGQNHYGAGHLNGNEQSTELHPFEIAQLGSISCEDADEAKTLIPSLTNKLNDEDLERILKELNNLETLY